MVPEGSPFFDELAQEARISSARAIPSLKIVPFVFILHSSDIFPGTISGMN
jgi:hypothetical protein